MGTDKKSAAVIFSLTLLELLLLHAFGWLQLFTGLLLVYVLPGLSLTLLLFHRNKLNLLEYAVSTIVLSLSLNILTILSSNLLLGVPITYATVTTQILAVSSCFLLGYLFLRFRSWDGSHALGLGVGGWQVIALTAALLFISYTTYMIHEDYMFPLHSDEWQDLARATSIIEHRNIVMRNPYLKEETHQFDLEIGFNLFLAEFFILTGVDPVLFYQYLPAITSLIAGLALFVFVYELFGDFYPAFLSTVFLAGLKGTIFLLGTWFMVAMSLSIPFIYFILYCLTRALKDNSLPFYLATSVSLLALTVIHPGMGSFLYLTVVLYLAGLLVYLLLKREIDFSFRKTCVCFAGVSVIFLLPLASFAYSLGLLWRDSLHETVRYFFTEFIVFGRLLQYDGVYEPLFLYEFYGPVASVLAVAGLFFFVYRGRGGVVSAALFLSLVNLVLYQFEGFNLFLFYERTVYFVLLYFVILSGAGLFLFFDLFCGFSRRYSWGVIPSRVAVVFIFFVVLFLLFSAHGFYRVRMDKQITVDDYRAMRWLSTVAGHRVVMAHPRISDAIYPVSGNYVVSPMSHSFSGVDSRINDVNRFFLANCSDKMSLLERYDVDYVYFRFRMGCGFLREVYNDSVYLYQVS